MAIEAIQELQPLAELRDDEVLARKINKRLTIPNRRIVEWISVEKTNDTFWVAYVMFWHQVANEVYADPDEVAYQVFLDKPVLEGGEIIQLRRCPQA